MKRRALSTHSVLLFARFSYAHVGPGRDDFERIDNSSDIAQHAGSAEIVIAFDVERGNCDIIVTPSPTLSALSTQYYSDVTPAYDAEPLCRT